METLTFNLSKSGKDFKILNATNGGPWHKRHTSDQYRSNFEDYKAARIPYSRNHDSGVCGIYGGPFGHDISKIFPNFNADEMNPEAYDFACTDEAILACLDAGTETFFRLGETIEHQIKKHATLPPKDFEKWARICEQIIRHYNEGWANGYKLNIQYWEIWNEPDLDPDGVVNRRTWGGNQALFFDFFEIAAKHLKKTFPHIKIGGPALAGRTEWGEQFIAEMQKRNVPMDFFSWHIYCQTPQEMMERAKIIKDFLNKYGYENAESILNEWNYVKGWTDEFVYTIKSIHGIKGATFTMSCISEAQQCDGIDMLMYYDTRPSVFNGAFDFYTYEKLKGYYPLYWYGKFYDMEKEIKSDNKLKDIYSLCGVDKYGKAMAVVTYYKEDDEDQEPKYIHLDFGKESVWEVYLLDKDHDGELIDTTSSTLLELYNYSSILIKEK